MWHEQKKTNNEEWSAAVRAGNLTNAIRKINPHRRTGPWKVLCDNESFLRHESSLRACAAKHVLLWGVPAKSPDLNPIEMFWGWVRRQLRLKDLEDMREKRPVLGKTAYKVRVKNLFRSQKAGGEAVRSEIEEHVLAGHQEQRRRGQQLSLTPLRIDWLCRL